MKTTGFYSLRLSYSKAGTVDVDLHDMMLPTYLGLANYILQLLFIRITKHTERHITGFKAQTFSITASGTALSGIIEDYEIIQWYSIQYWIVPFTGWWNGFIYLGNGPKYLQLTRKKKV